MAPGSKIISSRPTVWLITTFAIAICILAIIIGALALRRGRQMYVEVHVVDGASGKSVRDARVIATSTGWAANHEESVFAGVTDADGRVRLSGTAKHVFFDFSCQASSPGKLGGRLVPRGETETVITLKPLRPSAQGEWYYQYESFGSGFGHRIDWDKIEARAVRRE